MRASAKEDEHAAIGEGPDADDRLAAVDIEPVHVERRPSGGDVVPDALVDEVDGKNGLENLLGRDLALLEDALVLGPALLGGDVGLDDGTAEDGKVRVRPLRRQLVGCGRSGRKGRSVLSSGPAKHARGDVQMRPSSQAVVIVLSSKSLVSSRVMRYSTVVRKSPRIESSLRATTMFLRAVGRSEP